MIYRGSSEKRGLEISETALTANCEGWVNRVPEGRLEIAHHFSGGKTRPFLQIQSRRDGWY